MGETTVYAVRGMTCDHCASAVRTELAGVDGVRGVEVALEASGASRVAVTSDGPLDDAAVRSAVEEAGYTVVP